MFGPQYSSVNSAFTVNNQETPLYPDYKVKLSILTQESIELSYWITILPTIEFV
jgi:hypothetical protein